MKKKILLGAVALLAVVATFSSCSRGSEETLIVASETRTCYGVGKHQCMLVKSAELDPWLFFYGEIKGFDYEPGYEYVIKVRKKEVENPPQDAPAVKYTLVKVVSQEPITSEDMPVEVE